jgi:hypothetical protein
VVAVRLLFGKSQDELEVLVLGGRPPVAGDHQALLRVLMWRRLERSWKMAIVNY